MTPIGSQLSFMNLIDGGLYGTDGSSDEYVLGTNVALYLFGATVDINGDLDGTVALQADGSAMAIDVDIYGNAYFVNVANGRYVVFWKVRGGGWEVMRGREDIIHGQAQWCVAPVEGDDGATYHLTWAPLPDSLHVFFDGRYCEIGPGKNMSYADDGARPSDGGTLTILKLPTRDEQAFLPTGRTLICHYQVAPGGGLQ